MYETYYTEGAPSVTLIEGDLSLATGNEAVGAAIVITTREGALELRDALLQLYPVQNDPVKLSTLAKRLLPLLRESDSGTSMLSHRLGIHPRTIRDALFELEAAGKVNLIPTPQDRKPGTVHFFAWISRPAVAQKQGDPQ